MANITTQLKTYVVHAIIDVKLVIIMMSVWPVRVLIIECLKLKKKGMIEIEI